MTGQTALCMRRLHQWVPGAQRCQECERMRQRRYQRMERRTKIVALEYEVIERAEVPGRSTTVERGDWAALFRHMDLLGPTKAVRVRLGDFNLYIDKLRHIARVYGYRVAHRVRGNRLYLYNLRRVNRGGADGR